MAAILGMNGKLYRNTGVWATPVWAEVKNVTSVTLNLEKSEADVTTRKNKGWRAMIGALKEGSVDFEMIWDTSDDDFQAFVDAWLNDTIIDVAVMDGDIISAGSEGLRAEMAVITVTRQEPLEEAMKATVNIKPTYSENAPEWMVIT